MASETLQKFAEELRVTREAKEISILQISNRTKIDPKFLNAIENADFDILPELYVRAFIKEFAQTIDLNPKETIQKYELAKTGKTENALNATAEQISPTPLSVEIKKTNATELEEKNKPIKIENQPVKEFDSAQSELSKLQDDAPKNFLKSARAKCLRKYSTF
ncbi:MAG: transcriptional regulator XRE family [Stygiobacter sp.]|nr:MAG: transcriptional regulator XRE family [Stygiobacter sp.]